MFNGDYILVKAPKEYPGKKYRGRYCYEHHLVWWENTGEVFGYDYVIHHKDGDKYNNSFTNLEKDSRLSHSRKHAKTNQVEITCDWCGTIFCKSASYFNYKKSQGQRYLYCSKPCSTSGQHNL